MIENTPVPPGSCPLPLPSAGFVTLGMGGGGLLTQELVQKMFLPYLGNQELEKMNDYATINLNTPHVVVTTDGYVVDPIFFPGGDIGKLSVCGTVNDLAMSGAIPRYLAVSFIIEEGLAFENLRRVIASMAQTCQQAGVQVVCGDTKVVPKGRGDQIFITTTGIGVIAHGYQLGPQRIQANDVVLVSGTVGDHGATIMAQRENLQFTGALSSDCAPLHDLVQGMMDIAGGGIRMMRDPTRGGVAATLHEIAQAASVGIKLDETLIPVQKEVQSLCEILGLDPLSLANEGKLVVICAADVSATLLSYMRKHPLAHKSQVIGGIIEKHPGQVIIQSLTGVERLLPQMTAELLPRIC